MIKCHIKGLMKLRAQNLLVEDLLGMKTRDNFVMKLLHATALICTHAARIWQCHHGSACFAQTHQLLSDVLGSSASGKFEASWLEWLSGCLKLSEQLNSNIFQNIIGQSSHPRNFRSYCTILKMTKDWFKQFVEDMGHIRLGYLFQKIFGNLIDHWCRFSKYGRRCGSCLAGGLHGRPKRPKWWLEFTCINLHFTLNWWILRIQKIPIINKLSNELYF